jgi:hypothetical protein
MNYFQEQSGIFIPGCSVIDKTSLTEQCLKLICYNTH